MMMLAHTKLSLKIKNSAAQVGSRCRLMFPSKSNLLKSPLPAHFYGRTDGWKAREDGRASWAGFDSDEHGMGANKKFFQLSFTTLSYIKKSVLALSWIVTADSSIDTRLKLWPGQKGLLFPINTGIAITPGKSREEHPTMSGKVSSDMASFHNSQPQL